MIRRRIALVYGGISAAVTGTRLAVRQIDYNSVVRHSTRPEDIVKDGRYIRHSPADLAIIFSAGRTVRLVLRRLQESDGPAFFTVDGDPATHRYTPAGPAPDIASSEQRLQGRLEQWKEEGYGYWAAILPQTEQILGFGGIRRDVWRERDVLNLYYRFTPSAWGQGYATELVQTAVALAQEHPQPWPVIARTRPGNIAAVRTAERAGLRRRPDLDTEYVVLALNWPAETSPSSSLTCRA